MAQITSDIVKKLRDMTGAGMMDCKRALEETNGDMNAAVEQLRKKGAATAAKRADKEANQGVVEAYIHAGGRIGSMVELNCETDFVAKTPGFKQLAHDIAMQIAAMNPQFISRENVDQNTIAKELDIYRAQAKNEGKPEAVADKIAQGRLEKFYQESVLLEQSFIKDSGKTIKDIVEEEVSKVGEKIQIRRFMRYHLGESSPS
ncbi:MAG: translation elongation factor Ts [Ignavibacteria bacterium GWA2_55_11]|nr:MAG: translation elongation factor Ts [Ignavibacteria bacterium GWA2_55_11]OGU46819.1 MAG: translation elongation factor Ts [Ignavibacteria bacterium GWC2_56_12]OGU62756.1 MAG: translation elongation factor Ts [Ignavibacteria bacterium RIFCSPHIGHO2_02_FULL_56_12]OGU69773.1 MAG: translation elongation factor Ts [Ignavibacteria bacterium RIFCSPLOWO2_02_FULL_55_14]OGU73227.1 MAG: translation elongation factor Ts [Ignavibacteria bacterium RIFCSPLOWO2_12_FULL_56_21]HAV23264.1 translation elongat